MGRPSSVISDSSATEDEVVPSSPRSPLLSDQDSSLPRTPESPSAPTKNLFKRYKHNFKRRFRRSPSDQALLISEEQGNIKSTSSSKSGVLNDKTNEKQLTGERTPPQQQKPPSGRKNSGTVNSPLPKRTRTNQGNINFQGMSQWRYPTDQLINDAQALEQMNVFIQSKVKYTS